MNQATTTDPRRVAAGKIIPTQSYADQPYIVRTDDGAWLCCVTTGPGHEGARGQHVTTLRSTDRGGNWSDPVAIEPPDSPENSYAVMLKVTTPETRNLHPETSGAPKGRIYIFYNHNTDNVREVKCHNGRDTFDRVDSLGHFVFKYSDDHGRSWSAQRYAIPIREFACDRENIYGGALRFFWNVGKPFVHGDAAFVSLHKVGQMGEGFFQQSEGVLLKSANLLTEPDPTAIAWETLPDGEIGLRTPPGGGPIAEEQSYCVLSDGSFYCVYRSIDGYPVESYSRDGGHTWTEPRYKRYADGRLMKNPRAANFAWRCSNGKYLYWFHNHGGRFIRELTGPPSAANGLVAGGRSPYDDRNPVWLSGGVEIDTPAGREIAWSQPEIVLYDDDPMVRMSYPDLVEEAGCVYLTETQKETARVHEVDPALLEGLWAEAGGRRPEGGGRSLLALPQDGEAMPREAPMPRLPAFVERDMTRHDYGTRDLRNGFTLELCVDGDAGVPGRALIDTRTAWGQGLALITAPDSAVTLVLNDGRTENRWACDPGMLTAGRRHRVTVIVDGGPRLILFVIDGKLNDGGEHRQFGWGRFSPHLRDANGADRMRIDPAVCALRLYDRALRVSEACRGAAAGCTSTEKG
ncbi:MAG: hypothetical protein JW951_04795 [Lentisphaerae bacterium]|nr:hypothetical protein [Lentisphaerota bacterium]